MVTGFSDRLTKEVIRSRIDSKEWDYYKVIYADEICGGIGVKKVSKKCNYLVIIYIDPEYQNRKIAQKAIDLVHNKYPIETKWTLDFPANLSANKKCYENMGYKDTGKREVINDKLTLAYYER